MHGEINGNGNGLFNHSHTFASGVVSKRKTTQDFEQMATTEEQEIFQELGLTQERRRIAVRNKDYQILKEDELNTKV